jgi:hypothetical protein
MVVLEEKSFINATASFQLRGQTGRAKDATGNLFNATIEKSCRSRN